MLKTYKVTFDKTINVNGIPRKPKDKLKADSSEQEIKNLISYCYIKEVKEKCKLK